MVKEDVRKEKELIEREKKTKEEGNVQGNTEVNVKLQEHRKVMHPGYSFTGDNVDLRCNPRQLTVKNRTKDNHMFQVVAFKNRVPSNHLSNETQQKDVEKEPVKTFLPSPGEQLKLVGEFVVLIGHKWAKYIPTPRWFKDHLPPRIVHENMQ